MVRDAVRPRRDHHGAPDARVPAADRRRDARRSWRAYQATEVDDWRDAEPGKILHELRTGEMAGAGELPHTPYYGSVDSTPLWLVLLGATFDWTGDRAFVDRLWPNALAALDWIDRYGDLDGDGFVEYERRSTRGLLNQGWKDSGDAIRDRDGRGPTTPIALAEVQGYVFDAKRRMAGLAADARRDGPRRRLVAEAAALRERFEEAFWVEDQGYYAMALDGDKRQLDAIGSNAGPVPLERDRLAGAGPRVAERLLGPGDVLGLGHPDLRRGPAGLQPDRLSHRHPSGRTTTRSRRRAEALRPPRGGEPARRPGVRGHQHFRDSRLPELFCGFDRAASHARAVSRRLLTAGWSREPPSALTITARSRGKYFSSPARMACTTGPIVEALL